MSRAGTARRSRGASRIQAFLAPLLSVTVTLAPSLAGAVTKKECAAAYEETQSLQKDGKLTAAREKALFCAQAACPAVVRRDCAKWLGEIETSQPTVVFSAIGPTGDETAAARVLLDGALLAERTDGKAVAVDPGEHAFRFELDGAAPVEKKLVLREGEKLRKVVVSFAAPKVVEPPVKEAPASGVPIGPIVIGAAGLAAIGVGATFGGLGLAERGDLERTCAPVCAADRVDSVRTKLLVADVTAAAGVAALGAAVIVYLLTRPGSPAPAREAASRVWIGAGPASGGGAGVIRVPF